MRRAKSSGKITLSGLLFVAFLIALTLFGFARLLPKSHWRLWDTVIESLLYTPKANEIPVEPYEQPDGDHHALEDEDFCEHGDDEEPLEYYLPTPHMPESDIEGERTEAENSELSL